MPLQHGALFAGYTVRRLLGSGGMGDVYLVEHPRLPRLDALKVLREPATDVDDFRGRFNREAELAAALWHPHIVGLHDRGEFDGQLWISMDFVDGVDAARLLANHPRGLPLETVVAVVEAVGAALDYAHERGLLHRDIKPANILITPGSGAQRRILLSDFGIARRMGEVSGLTAVNHAVGTVAYSAPEQLMGAHVDGRADQYSLAATAFRLLTGSSPFPESNPVAVISSHLNTPPPRVSDRRPELAPLDGVLGTAMAKDPRQRFPTCTAFAQAFAHQAATVHAIRQPAPQLAPISSQLAFAPPKRSSRRWVVGGAVALVVALVAAGVLVALSGSGDDATTAGPAASSTSASASASASALPTVLPAPRLIGTPGNYETITTYLDSRGIERSAQHRGDHHAPTVLTPMPGGTWHQGGADTPNYAYEMLVYDVAAPHAGAYPPFVIVSVDKLDGDVDAQALFMRASGDLNNLAGFVASGPGTTGTLKVYPEYQLSGEWDVKPGQRQFITQRIVLCQWKSGLYLVQLNLSAAPQDRPIADEMITAIGDGLVIVAP